MSICVISEQGSRISKKGRQLIARKNGEVIFVFPLAGLQRLIVIGRVEVSTVLYTLLLDAGIDLVFLKSDGRFRGRLSGPAGKNVILRRDQYLKLNDPAFVLSFARTIVQGKAANAMRVFSKINPSVHREMMPRYRNFQRAAAEAADLYTLRGLEGSFSALYFRYFRIVLRHRFGFTKRIKHPPPDPVNILLSFGYTLLFNAVFGFLEAHGIDPYCGLYHQLSYGHAALASDLMEEFRAPLVDRMVIRLINRKQISKDAFEKVDDQIRIKREGVGILVKAWMKQLQTKTEWQGERHSYLGIIQRQMEWFMQTINGKRENYDCFPYR